MTNYNIQNTLYLIVQTITSQPPEISFKRTNILLILDNAIWNLQQFKLIGKMTKKAFLILLLALVISVKCTEPLLAGKITFFKSGNTKQTAFLRPLSQQPKIANLKNSQIELVIITEEESCGVLSKSQFQRGANEPPVLAVIDFSKSQRLSCGMTLKINRIKEAGGYGFIIITNNQQFSINHCRMYDDNSFFTGVMDSNNFQIVKALRTERLYGILTIELKDSSLSLLEIWTSSLNPDSYDSLLLLQRTFKNLKTLKDKVEWMPRISSLGCKHGQDAKICNKDDYVASCACKGQFCSPEAHGRSSNILVQEDIRQHLIFSKHYTQYFSYIRLFKDQCLSNYIKDKYAEDCSRSIMEKLAIDSKSINEDIQKFFQECVVQEQFDIVSKKQIYTTLNRDKNAFQNYGRYPLLLLNKKIIEFKSEDDLRGQLCRKMQLEDQGCYEVNHSQVKTTTVATIFYILLVLVLMAVGAAVVYLYRKKLKKDMNKQIKMQVSTAVEHYFALTEVK